MLQVSLLNSGLWTHAWHLYNKIKKRYVTFDFDRHSILNVEYFHVFGGIIETIGRVYITSSYVTIDWGWFVLSVRAGITGTNGIYQQSCNKVVYE